MKKKKIIYVTIEEKLHRDLMASLKARLIETKKAVLITDFVVEACEAHIKKWLK